MNPSSDVYRFTGSERGVGRTELDPLGELALAAKVFRIDS
jgi:hypothetical protein